MNNSGTSKEQVRDLEHSYISGIFLAANLGRDNEVVNGLFDIGNEAIFGIPRHQEVVRALKDAFDEDGGASAVSDPTKIYRRLRPGTFDDFESLANFLGDNPYATSDLPYTLGEIRDAHIRRQTALIGADLQIQSSAVTSVNEVIQNSIDALVRLRETQVSRGATSGVDYREGLEQAIRDIEEAMERTELGIPIDVAPTNIEFLNTLMNGGARPGTLTFLAARPGVGKTAFGVEWLFHAVAAMNDPEEWGSLVILEMGLKEVIFRDLAGETEIFSSKMFNGTVTRQELAIIKAAAARIKGQRNIVVHERVRTVDDCITAIHGSIMQKRRKPRMVVVDYLQLLEIQALQGVSINNSAAVGQISRKFKLFAKDMDIPVVVLSQLNREVENRSNRRPQLSDLRDSGNIEQDADNVMFLWQKNPPSSEDASLPTRVIGVDLAKHRNGGTGDGELTFHKAKTHFEALTGARSTDAATPTSTSYGVTRRLVDPGEED